MRRYFAHLSIDTLHSKRLRNGSVEICPPRQIRRYHKLYMWLLFAGYVMLSQLTRVVLLNETQSRENLNTRAITLKPGLLDIINATEVIYPVTLNPVYILENKTLCASLRSLDVAVMIYTAADNFERRNMMRQTWLNKTLLSRLGTARVIFLLGRVNTSSLQEEIENESRQHGDILQGGFMDTYANLTLKGVMGLKWLSENCKNAKILIKADDDIVINIYRFFQEILPAIMSHKQQVFCWRSPRSIIFRGVKHKSYMPKNYFHGMKSYPLYCKGPFVFMTFDLVALILESASMTPFLWLEDLYLYGVVMQNIPGITYRQFIKGLDFHLEIETVMECFNDTVVPCEMFVAGVSKTDQMMSVWKAMLTQNQLLGVAG